MIIDSKIIPIILSGGVGTRLWPLSRKSFPKQYQNIIKKNNASLIQQTYKRIKGVKNLEKPIIICNEEHRFIVAEQMREINICPKSILLEPFGKNTSAAITLASLQSINLYADPILLVLSADHEIDNNEDFKKTISEAREHAEKGNIVTFGVPPTSPEVGYGYIEANKEINQTSSEAYKIVKFIEKPNKAKAIELIKNKKFLWNSGIFMFKAKVMLEEVKKYAPKVYSCCQESLENKTSDLDFERLSSRGLMDCPNLSIDIAVMEKTDKGVVVP